MGVREKQAKGISPFHLKFLLSCGEINGINWQFSLEKLNWLKI